MLLKVLLLVVTLLPTPKLVTFVISLFFLGAQCVLGFLILF